MSIEARRAAIRHDRETGVGTSTGYAGHGVAFGESWASTLVDLVLKRDTEFTHSPVVNRRSKDWEPEPIRWTDIQSMCRLFRTADAW